MALFRKKKTAAPKMGEPRPENSGREKPTEKKEPASAKASASVKTSADKSAGKEKRIDFAWSVLKRAHITEKATDAVALNKYIFNVYPQRNKGEIRKAVENIYGVDVISVNIVNIPAKKRRLGKAQGWKSGYKKAIVRIKDGQKIEIMPR